MPPTCRLSVAPRPLHGPVDQPSVRVLQRTGEPDVQLQEAVVEPEEAPAAAEGPGPPQTRSSTRQRAQTFTRVPSLQEDLFSSAKSNEVVASNEDDAVELMMYRQRSSGSDVPESPPEPLPDELGPAERGEAPPIREVRNQGKGQPGLFFPRWNRGLNSPSPPFCRFLQSLEIIIGSATSR